MQTFELEFSNSPYPTEEQVKQNFEARYMYLHTLNVKSYNKNHHDACINEHQKPCKDTKPFQNQTCNIGRLSETKIGQKSKSPVSKDQISDPFTLLEIYENERVQVILL